MAIKHLIALCLVFAIVFVNATPEAVAEPEAEAEADADADAWYGYYRGYGGYGYGHRYGFGGYRPYGYGYHYQRRPYHYKPRPVLEVSTPPKIINRYGYRLLPEAPAPAPVVAPAPSPAPAPAFVRQEEPIVVTPEEPVQIELMKSSVLPLHPVIKDHQDHYAALGAVPAVPEDHFGALPYMAAPTLPPAVVPAPVAPAAPVATPTRAADIVPVFNNEIDAFAAVPEESLIVAPEPAPEPAEPAPAVVEVYENDIDVIEAAVPAVEEEVHAAPAFAPVQAPSPAQGVVASQYHAQDEFGNVVYGYSNPNSAKSEQRDAYGNVMGSYSYVDDTGYPKHVAYVADDFGFRIINANNFPVGPAV